MVEVVLQLVGTFSKRAERVVVGVVIRGGTQQIVHRLIVIVDVVSSEKSISPRTVLRQIRSQRSGQCEVQLIVVALLDIVERILPVGCSLAVSIDELVEVDLAVAFTASQILAGVLPVSQCELSVLHVAAVPHIVEVARQPFVIVRLRILRVVIVELRAGIHAVLSEERGCQLVVVVDIPVPSEDSRRSKVTHHSAVTLLTVLPAPIGIVLIVVGQPIHLIGRRSLRTALGGVTPCREGKAMTAAKEFLHAEEIGKRIVRRTLDISRIGPAIGDVGRVSPALFCQTTVIGIHATEYIVTVGNREREALACGHSSRTEVVIIRSGDTRIRKVVRLEGQCRLHIACLLVETAYERVAELSRLHVVDRRAVDIHLVILLVERPIAEPHR